MLRSNQEHLHAILLAPSLLVLTAAAIMIDMAALVKKPTTDYGSVVATLWVVWAGSRCLLPSACHLG